MSIATSQPAAPCRELHVWHARDFPERAASRTLLREALSAYAQAAAADLRFLTGPRGKPSLVPKPDGPDVRYNLSHSGGRLLIAVTTGREVGVDVEHVEGVRAAEGLVRFLAPAERELLEGCDAKRRRQMIAQLWTAKEAVLKATGEGICRSLRALDVSPVIAAGTATLRRPVVGGREIREWTVRPIDVGTGYAAAVAFEGGPGVGLTVLDWPDPD